MNSFGKERTCHRCKGTGKDAGIQHASLGQVSSKDMMEVFQQSYESQRQTHRKLTGVQVAYILKMSGSLSMPVVARDMNVSERTVRNIWQRKIYEVDKI